MNKKNCNHEDGYGTTSLNGLDCFICHKQLSVKQSSLIYATQVLVKVQKWYEEVKTEYNESKGSDAGQYELKPLMKRLERILKR